MLPLSSSKSPALNPSLHLAPHPVHTQPCRLNKDFAASALFIVTAALRETHSFATKHSKRTTFWWWVHRARCITTACAWFFCVRAVCVCVALGALHCSLSLYVCAIVWQKASLKHGSFGVLFCRRFFPSLSLFPPFCDRVVQCVVAIVT